MADATRVSHEVIVRMVKLESSITVTLAEDGLQAADKIGELMENNGAEAYSLIFMNIQMPNMDGIEATKQIRSMGFKGSIIALTAFDHVSNREACWQAGVDNFTDKPVKRKTLREALQKFTKDEGKVDHEKDKEKASRSATLNILDTCEAAGIRSLRSWV